MKDNAGCIVRLLFMLALIVSFVCLTLTAQAAELPPLKIVWASGGLNVRESPNTEARATYLLENTETVFVIEWQNGWALVAKNVSTDMILGWVCGDYLK